MAPQDPVREDLGRARGARRRAGEPDLLYIDLHLVHEVTSPQAFEALRLAGRAVRRPDLTLATVDHNVPTIGPRRSPIPTRSRGSRSTTLRDNCHEFGIPLYDLRQRGRASST